MLTLYDGKYELTRDKFGWTLAELTPSVSRKTGKPTVSRWETYYARLEQALSVIADREAGKATDVADVLARWDALVGEFKKVKEGGK